MFRTVFDYPHPCRFTLTNPQPSDIPTRNYRNISIPHSLKYFSCIIKTSTRVWWEVQAVDFLSPLLPPPVASHMKTKLEVSSSRICFLWDRNPWFVFRSSNFAIHTECPVLQGFLVPHERRHTHTHRRLQVPFKVVLWDRRVSVGSKLSTHQFVTLRNKRSNFSLIYSL